MSAAKDAGLIEKLRTWRRDASSLHQYEAAAFVGDKVLSITSKALQYLCLIRRGRFGCVLAGAYLLPHSVVRASTCASHKAKLP